MRGRTFSAADQRRARRPRFTARDEALFRAVIEKSAEIISTTADGVTVDVAAEHLGWSPEDIGSESFRDVPEDRVRVATELDRVVNSGARGLPRSHSGRRSNRRGPNPDVGGTATATSPDASSPRRRCRRANALPAAHRRAAGSRIRRSRPTRRARVRSVSRQLISWACARHDRRHERRPCCPSSAELTCARDG